jgi:uncharacterized protein
MRFSWDRAKARSNLAKHGINFDVAKRVFNDPHLVILEDCDDEFGEMRYHAIGYAATHLLLLVIFVDRGEHDEEIIHILSARKADDYEHKTYARQFTEGD